MSEKDYSVRKNSGHQNVQMCTGAGSKDKW